MDSHWFIWIHIDSNGFILIHVDLSMSFCFGHWWSLQIWAQMDCLWTNRVWSGETCQDKPSSFPTAVGESHTFYDMNSPNDSGQDLFRFFVFCLCRHSLQKDHMQPYPVVIFYCFRQVPTFSYASWSWVLHRSWLNLFSVNPCQCHRLKAAEGSRE